MIWAVFQARDLLKSLMTIGLVVGFSLGCCAISQVFTKDLAIIAQVCIGADLKIFANCDVGTIFDNVKMDKSQSLCF
jgi:hypothetical protein